MADNSLTSVDDSSTTATNEDFSNLTDIAGEESILILTGPSAYQLAVANGYKGTLEEWLQSLSSNLNSNTPTPTDLNPDALLGQVVDKALNSQQLDSNGTLDNALVTDPLSVTNEKVALSYLLSELYTERKGYLKNNTDNIIAGDMLSFSGNKDGIDLSFGFSTIRDPITGNLFSAIYDSYGQTMTFITPDRIVLSPGNGGNTGTGLNAIVLTGNNPPAKTSDDGTQGELRFDDTNGIMWRKTASQWVSFYSTDSKPDGGGGGSVDPSKDATITGNYTFEGNVIVPTVATNDNSQNAASTAWVLAQGFSKSSISISPDTGSVPNGTAGSVENVGTAAAPILKFTLVDGPKGDSGVGISSITVNPDLSFGFKMTDGSTSTSQSGIYLNSDGTLIYPETVGVLPTDLVLNGNVYTAPSAYINGTETLPTGLYLNSDIVMTDGTVYFPETLNNVGVLCAA